MPTFLSTVFPLSLRSGHSKVIPSSCTFLCARGSVIEKKSIEATPILPNLHDFDKSLPLNRFEE